MWVCVFILIINFCFLCFLYTEAIKRFVCWRDERNPLRICLESCYRTPAPWETCETVQLVSVVLLFQGGTGFCPRRALVDYTDVYLKLTSIFKV